MVFCGGFILLDVLVLVFFMHEIGNSFCFVFL